MTRAINVGAAQLGPIQTTDSRASVVERLIALLHQAKQRGCELVVFPELALTTFFPRWWVDDLREADHYYERSMPSAETQPLFDTARQLEIGFHLGYAELVEDDSGVHRYNTAILVDQGGKIVGKYRKVHLPGHGDNQPWRPFQHLEKYYFEVGDLGFKAFRAFGGILGMCICNDRRWPETYRMLGMQGAEMIVLGYNTPIYQADMPEVNHLQGFHNLLCMQSGAYQNGTWVIGVAKAGCEEGYDLLGQSAIIAPSGEIVAMTHTVADELITARCDLDACKPFKETVFNFAAHRRPEQYGLITQRAGAEPPPEE